MKKKICAMLITLVLTFSSAMATAVFASSGNNDRPTDVLIVDTDEAIAQEIKAAFSETFNSTFNEDDFPGMIITYAEDGIPIVTDPNTPILRAVYATARFEKNGFYSASSCSSSTLVFYVLKGQSVTVTNSSVTTKVAKVKYAQSVGYMKKSELKF